MGDAALGPILNRILQRAADTSDLKHQFQMVGFVPSPWTQGSGFMCQTLMSGTCQRKQDSNPENGVPDYVDEVGAIADSAYHVLVNIMEFSAPPADEDGFYDIYLEISHM